MNRLYRQLAQDAIELIEAVHITTNNPDVKRAASRWLLRYYEMKHQELLRRKNLNIDMDEAFGPTTRASMFTAAECE